MHNNKIKIIYHKEQIEISSATVFYRIATTQLDENVIFSLGSGGRGEGGEADLTCSVTDTTVIITVITGTSQHELGQCLALRKKRRGEVIGRY